MHMNSNWAFYKHYSWNTAPCSQWVQVKSTSYVSHKMCTDVIEGMHYSKVHSTSRWWTKQKIQDLHLLLYLDLMLQITSLKESAVRRISETRICPKKESITVHEAETYLKSLTSKSSYWWVNTTELPRTHTAYICVSATRWWMMKTSQNGVLLLQSHPHLQKGAKCETGKYRPVSSLGAFF